MKTLRGTSSYSLCRVVKIGIKRTQTKYTNLREPEHVNALKKTSGRIQKRISTMTGGLDSLCCAQTSKNTTSSYKTP